MEAHAIEKALEVWTLQNLLNFSILLGWLTLGLMLIQDYYKEIEKLLTLRVSIELWRATTTVLIDIFLAFIVLVGFITLNPDIMADIKVAVPFVPAAFLFFAIALIIRLFYKGYDSKNMSFFTALWLTFIANLLNIIGFTFVMEAPGDEYLELHPSEFWTFVKTHFVSNASPHGLEMAQTSFYIFFPLMILIFIWGFGVALRKLKNNTTK